MTDQTEYDRQRALLADHVGNLLEAAGLRRDDMLLTDVVVVATQRGYCEGGGTSLTTSLVPTDTTTPMAIGMLQVALVEANQRVARLYNSFDEEDET